MAHNKPPIVAELKEGKPIQTVAHFCATVNWLIDCLRNLYATQGVSLEGLEVGRPVLRARLKAGEGIDIKSTGDFDSELEISATGEGGDGFNGIKVVADNGTFEGVKEIEFTHAEDSNVVVNGAKDGDKLTLALGVYYT